MAKKKKKAAKKGAAPVAVASRIKDYVKGKGLRSDGGLADAVDAKVKQLLDEAVKRCKGNKRGTVRPHDL